MSAYVINCTQVTLPLACRWVFRDQVLTARRGHCKSYRKQLLYSVMINNSRHRIQCSVYRMQRDGHCCQWCIGKFLFAGTFLSGRSVAVQPRMVVLPQKIVLNSTLLFVCILWRRKKKRKLRKWFYIIFFIILSYYTHGERPLVGKNHSHKGDEADDILTVNEISGLWWLTERI